MQNACPGSVIPQVSTTYRIAKAEDDTPTQKNPSSTEQADEHPSPSWSDECQDRIAESEKEGCYLDVAIIALLRVEPLGCHRERASGLEHRSARTGRWTESFPTQTENELPLSVPPRS
eukprot:3231380-Rhodomonas_salina.5